MTGLKLSTSPTRKISPTRKVGFNEHCQLSRGYTGLSLKRSGDLCRFMCDCIAWGGFEEHWIGCYLALWDRLGMIRDENDGLHFLLDFVTTSAP